MVESTQLWTRSRKELTVTWKIGDILKLKLSFPLKPTWVACWVKMLEILRSVSFVCLCMLWEYEHDSLKVIDDCQWNSSEFSSGSQLCQQQLGKDRVYLLEAMRIINLDIRPSSCDGLLHRIWMLWVKRYRNAYRSPKFGSAGAPPFGMASVSLAFAWVSMLNLISIG